MDFEQITNDLISEIKLTRIQAKVFLLIVFEGKMSVEQISQKLGIKNDEALDAANDLMKLGGFIDMSETKFEAMHPRFSAVNMYRKMCERKNLEFKRNIKVDNIGVVLEKPYDVARTK